MEKQQFYWKRRLVSEIYGPTELGEIIALNDADNIQICNFVAVHWLWLCDFLPCHK